METATQQLIKRLKQTNAHLRLENLRLYRQTKIDGRLLDEYMEADIEQDKYIRFQKKVIDAQSETIRGKDDTQK